VPGGSVGTAGSAPAGPASANALSPMAAPATSILAALVGVARMRLRPVMSWTLAHHYHFPHSALSDRGPEQIVGVFDDVAVTLLGEEALPVRGVFGVEAVAGDHAVEHRTAAVGLGSQQPAEPLCFFLA
jgi:hypothetical protein